MTRQLNIRLEASATFETGPNKPWPLGTRGHAPDGRVFRTARAGNTALMPGRTAQAVVPDPRMRNLVPAAQTDARNNALDLAFYKASDTVGPDVGEYSEGLLYVTAGDGVGYVYRIESSGDINDNVLKLILDSSDKTSGADARIFGMTTATRVTLLKNRFTGLAIAGSPPETAVLGVSPTAVTADYYFWLQTHGACAVMQDGLLEVYRPIAASNTTQGAVRLATTTVPDPGAVEGLHSSESVAVVPVIRPADRDAMRLAPVTGVGVVPEVQLGYVLDENESSTWALAHLAVEA